MKRILSFFLLLVFVILPVSSLSQKRPTLTNVKQLQSPQNPRLGFVIHGGAGVIRRGDLSPEKEKAYRDSLEQAVLAGYRVLQNGGTSLDAVETAIRMLEDNPLFNAGKGAVFTNDGKNELDSSIMDGRTLAAGAVAGLHRIKNPISLARMVMEKSPHVMMAGAGAEKFAVQNGVKLVDEKYFWTEDRWKSLQRVLEQEKRKAEAEKNAKKASFNIDYAKEPVNKFGTVGAVALDKNGNLAAGTSTGGMTNKKFGRIGDAPIIGAGTYANNNTCAISATGWGEFFIRAGVARDISALMEYKGMSVQQASDTVLKKVQTLGGGGGVVAIDKMGNIGISFNSEGMYRAYINRDGKPIVEIYND
jgi:L-asparaginase / beta-aspartyl-peptidase